MKNVYDNKQFFDEYNKTRKQIVNANNLIENPIILQMMPDVKNKTILDLGCGDGNMAKRFMNSGAKHVVAVDISEAMISQAEQLNCDKNITYKVLKLEDLNFLNEKFDIVYSSLAFHYIEDFNKLLKDINNLLNNKGILIYSQESPLNTSSIIDDINQENKLEINGKRYYLLSDYCNEGERNNFWNGVRVTKYHRTYATIVNDLIKNNFEIEEIKDSFASEEAIALCDKYKYQKDKPYFTFVKASKK